MVFSDFLKLMVHKKASDLFITAGVPPSLKVDGKIVPITKQALSPEASRELAYSVMNEEQRRKFEATNECNFALNPASTGADHLRRRDLPYASDSGRRGRHERRWPGVRSDCSGRPQGSFSGPKAHASARGEDMDSRVEPSTAIVGR